jgi:hypothetical protein
MDPSGGAHFPAVAASHGITGVRREALAAKHFHMSTSIGILKGNS